MKYLICSDTHFSDKPKDAHRLGLFKWLRRQQELYGPDITIFAGDVTEEKNYHSSTLVNSVVEGFKTLRPPVYIDRGNHDGEDPTNPFFKFLSQINGLRFCVETTVVEDYKLVLIPHQRNQTAFDNAFKLLPRGFIAICHNTITGAISESGSRLTGLSVPPDNKARLILSGDIHRPQKIETEGGIVTYIGSPFHVRHGDQFEPRVLLLDNDKETNLYFPSPKKLSLTIRDVSEIPKLSAGDQVKITMELDRSEVIEWTNHKKRIIDYCKDHNLENYGTNMRVAQGRKRPRLVDTTTNKSKLDYFKTFCLAEQIPANIKGAGLSILGDER